MLQSIQQRENLKVFCLTESVEFYDIVFMVFDLLNICCLEIKRIKTSDP